MFSFDSSISLFKNYEGLSKPQKSCKINLLSDILIYSTHEKNNKLNLGINKTTHKRATH